jgi:hypothetical protein
LFSSQNWQKEEFFGFEALTANGTDTTMKPRSFHASSPFFAFVFRRFLPPELPRDRPSVPSGSHAGSGP